MIAMAHSLEKKVIAEGIEDKRTAALLKELNCNYMQGYYFGKPMPVFEFQEPKVVITNKDEFIDFVKQLSSEGFDEMALGYLDASTQLFGNDQDILALYHVVSGK